jgi:hypothetical protein
MIRSWSESGSSVLPCPGPPAHPGPRRRRQPSGHFPRAAFPAAPPAAVRSSAAGRRSRTRDARRHPCGKRPPATDPPANDTRASASRTACSARRRSEISSDIAIIPPTAPPVPRPQSRGAPPTAASAPSRRHGRSDPLPHARSPRPAPVGALPSRFHRSPGTLRSVDRPITFCPREAVVPSASAGSLRYSASPRSNIASAAGACSTKNSSCARLARKAASCSASATAVRRAASRASPIPPPDHPNPPHDQHEESDQASRHQNPGCRPDRAAVPRLRPPVRGPRPCCASFGKGSWRSHRPSMAMTSAEIRQSFLDFFARHANIRSCPRPRCCPIRPDCSSPTPA